MLNCVFICRTGRLLERHKHVPGAGQLRQWQAECVRSAETLLSHFRRSTQSRSEESRKQRKIVHNFGTVSSCNHLRRSRRCLMTLFHCRLNGKSCDLEWIREGHRNYPLIGRAPPYSALHILADHASKAAAIENSELPDPADTKRWRRLDEEITGKPIITDDPTLPPQSPAIFGISRKDLKKSLDLSTLHQSVRKKHNQHLKPPPPPNVKIQHLYQTLNAKRPRKSLTKKSSKARVTKPSPGRMHLPYPPDDQKHHFDGAELQRHLTSQLMPPPMSPVKSPYAPILPAGGKKDMNLIKMNHQSMEPQAHYIPNNPSRLKGDFMCEPTRGRSGRAKSINMQQRSNYQQQKYANGAGARNSMDHIPDPQIIFNTTSSKLDHTMEALQMEHNNHDMDMSPQAMASPLQLLSTAASCTPKLKVTTPVPHHQHQHQHQQPLQPATKPAPNRSVKIVPVNSKPMIIKPADAIKTTQAIVNNTAQSAKFKIQKIQLVMNKSQDGSSTTAGLSPSATIVSGKAGQLVFGGKGITNSYQIGGKSPYTIVSAPKASGPKVIVQAIDRSFALKEGAESSSIPENQRITENTPIDFLPSTTGTANFPKLLISKPQTVPPKQFKIKLGASIVNPKIIKGAIPANLKIQRNINTKGFTVVNSSQIVHLQAQTQAAQVVAATTAANPPATTTEGTKVDWEQELDDVNRTKGGKSTGKSNGSSSAAKKMRLDDGEVVVEEVPVTENVIVETVDVADPAVVVFGKFDRKCFSQDCTTVSVLDNTSSHIEVVSEPSQPNISELVSEYVFLNDDEVATKSADESLSISATVNGESAELNGQAELERQPQNGAEAYENLVKSLAECDSDYMKDIADDTPMDENFGLIDNNILDSFNFTRDTGLFQ